MTGIAEFKRNYLRQRSRRFLFIGAFVLLTVVAFTVTLGVSRYDGISFIEAFEVLLQHILGDGVSGELDDYVVWERLFPRALGTIMVGGALAVAGAVMQNLMHNPLADPYTTGISSGAGLGATLFLGLGVCVVPGVGGMAALVLNAFVFSLIPAAVMILFSMKKRATPSEIILIGVGVMYLFSGITTVIMLMAEPENLQSAYMWTMGNMGGCDWNSIPYITAGAVLGTVAIGFLQGQLNVMSAGDRIAGSLGVEASGFRRNGLIIVSLMVAMMVCFTGAIGFVGLVAPHIARMFVGSDMKCLLPASFFMGSALLLFSDALAKWFILPIGVITSIIGGPLFLYLLVKMHGQEVP